MSMTAYADESSDSGKWVLNDDGTLSIDAAAAKEAVSINSDQVTLVLIGSNGGTITLPADLGSEVVTKTSSAGDAALVLYKSGIAKDTVSTMLQNVKFSSDTTSINIDVTDGETNIDVSSNDTTFGILGVNGEAHIYKYVKESLSSWVDAFDKAVKGNERLGGFKGYLATITTTKEAELLYKFYTSVETSSTQGGWIAATSMRYSTEQNVSSYSDVQSSLVTPDNYDSTGLNFTKTNITSGYKITSANGAYYWPNITTTSTYKDAFYWACGPEKGQKVDSGLWNNNEPNNSGGESCVAASYNSNWSFNDFPPNQSVPGYFLEFSVYADGLASDTVAYKSTTIYIFTDYTDLTEGRYKISSVGENDYVLAVTDTSTTGNQNVGVAEEQKNELTQSWIVTKDSASTGYIFRPVSSRTERVLDVAGHWENGSGVSEGKEVAVWKTTETPSESNTAVFRISTYADESEYLIRTNDSKWALTVRDNNNVNIGAYNSLATQRWEIIPVNYKVAFNSNEGSGSMDTLEIQMESTGNKLSANAFTRAGYRFAGWNTKADGTGDSYADQAELTSNLTDTENETVTLYAQWTVINADAPTISAQPQKLELTYGYTEGSVSVTATAEEGHTLSYQWYSNTTDSNEGGAAIDGATSKSYTIPTGKNAGTTEYYYCVVTATRTDNGQMASTTSNAATVTVNKVNAVAATVTANNRTYDGTAKPLVTADESTLVGGEMQYALGTDATTAPAESSYTTSIPAATDAGS